MAPKQNRQGSDDDLAIDNDVSSETQSQGNLLARPVVLMTVVVLSPSIGFCWRLMLISFLSAYYYALFVIRSCQPPRKCRSFSLRMAKFMTRTIAHMSTLAALLAWCISITPVHIFTPTAMDMWTPYAVHDAFRMTEVVYDPGEDATIDIFAIHGLGSRPESAWTYRSNATQVRWLSELLPQARGLQDARVVMINHQTRWDANTAYMELHDYASELLEHIESQHKANPQRPIVFIAHSFGGILLKKALLLAKSRSTDVAAMTKGILFLGVPHRGTNATFVASCLSCMAYFRGSSSSLLEFMSVDGTGILDLESEFYDAYVLQHYPYQSQPYIYDVLEMRPERIGKLALGSIVRPKHGLVRHGRIMTLDTDHRGLNKFHSHDDPNFQILVRILLQAIDHAFHRAPSGDFCPPQPPPLPMPPMLPRMPIKEIEAVVPPKPREPREPRGISCQSFYGLPWRTPDRLHAVVTSGFEELTASWLAKDRDRHGSYFTRRIPKLIIFESVIAVSVTQGLDWMMLRLFKGRPSLQASVLQIAISSMAIVPMILIIDLAARAVVSGARNYHQIRATVRVGFWVAIRLYLVLSPISFLIAHYLLPPDSRRVFSGVCFFMVLTYVNTSTKKKRLAALRRRHFGEVRTMLEEPGVQLPPPLREQGAAREHDEVGKALQRIIGQQATPLRLIKEATTESSDSD